MAPRCSIATNGCAAGSTNARLTSIPAGIAGSESTSGMIKRCASEIVIAIMTALSRAETSASIGSKTRNEMAAVRNTAAQVISCVVVLTIRGSEAVDLAPENAGRLSPDNDQCAAPLFGDGSEVSASGFSLPRFKNSMLRVPSLSIAKNPH